MKKLLAALVILLVLGGVFFAWKLGYDSLNMSSNDKNNLLIRPGKQKTGTLTFKAEYEALNNSGENPLPTLDISKSVTIKYLNFSGVVDFLTTGSGVLYFGFPECPWCRILLPSLLQVAEDTNQTVYYYNPKEIRNSISLDETTGELVVEKETLPEYQILLDTMKDILPVYDGLGDESIKRLYVPFVVFVKDGEIVDHHLNVLEEIEDPRTPLTDEQKTTLYNILQEKLQKTQDTGSCSIGEPTC